MGCDRCVFNGSYDPPEPIEIGQSSISVFGKLPLVIYHSYWTWPIEIVDLPIKKDDFPIVFCKRLPEGTTTVPLWWSTCAAQATHCNVSRIWTCSELLKLTRPDSLYLIFCRLKGGACLACNNKGTSCLSRRVSHKWMEVDSPVQRLVCSLGASPQLVSGLW